MARALALAAGVVAVWAAIVAITGGVRYDLGPIRLSSRDALRPALAALVLAALAWRAGYRLPRAAIARGVAPFRPIVQPAAVALAVGVVLILGVTRGTRVAAGSDEFGYVSQSALWLQGSLRVDQSIAGRMPWPHVDDTFAPLGYRPVAGHAIVPTYAPGLPLLMAGTRLMSACGPYLIAPVAGALLVLVTYLLGRRVFSPAVALAGAALTAASPTVLIMTLSPASDVPAAAFWIGALLAAAPSWPRAVAAGILAGVAAAIRPNLVPLALFPWLLTIAPGTGWRTRAVTTTAYACALAPFLVLVARVNDVLYGSPLTSGYGSTSDLFALRHATVNVARYAGWWLETQGALAFLCVLAVVIAVLPSRPRRFESSVLLGFGSATVLLYLFYLPFDTWGFLRFLLPAIPVAFLFGADVVAWAAARFRPRLGAVAVAAFTLVSLAHAVGFTRRAGVLDTSEGEQKYADAGLYVARATPPGAVVLSSQHSGSIRYYSGRLTLRYDFLDPQWLDRAIEALERHGRPVYALLDDWEEPVFRKRFAGQRAVAHVERGPLAASRGGRLLFYAMAPAATVNVPPRIPRVSKSACWDISPDFTTTGRAQAFISARGAPPPLALARRLRASLGPQALPSSGVHLQVGVLLQSGDGNEDVAALDGEPFFRPAIRPLCPHGGDELPQVVARGSRAQGTPEIRAGARVEAHQPDAIGRQAAAIARLTEWLGRRRDDPERRTVLEPVARGRGGAALRHGLDRPEPRRQIVEHLASRHDGAARPPGGAPNVHVLDEPHLRADRPPERDHLRQLVVVDAAHDDRVDFEGFEARAGRGVDAREHRGVFVRPRERLESAPVQRVQAHGDAAEPRAPERGGLLREEHAVRRHREVGERRRGGQTLHERRQAAPQQRFAAGDTDAVDARAREGAGHARQLVERQQRVAREPRVVRLRHAVLAAQVAPVRHRDPQAAQRASEAIVNGGDHGVRSLH